MFRLFFPFCLIIAVLLSAFTASGAPGVTEIPLAVRSVVYDSFTDKLYASATNNLLQLDPLTGKVLNSFYLGTNVTLLSLGAENGIWAAIDGEQAICRFDLATLTVGDKIIVSIPGRSIFDISGSLTDPTLALVCLPTVPNHWAEALVVRNGAALPKSRSFPASIQINGALQGASVYLTSPSGSVLKMAIGANGLVDLNMSSPPNGISPQTLHILGSYLYCGGGFVLDANSLAPVSKGNLGDYGLVSVNPAENAAYYLTPGVNGSVITRFANPSLQKLGTAELGGVSVEALRSLAGYRNHAAFNTDSTLYIVDLEKVVNARPSALLEVVQTAPESIEFGSSFDLWVYITNRGPSTAQVTLTDSISSGTAFSSYGSSFSPYGWIPPEPSVVQPPSGFLAPGEGFSYVVTVQPSETGRFTNTLVLTSANTEPGQTVSMQVVKVVPPAGSVTTIGGLFYPCAGGCPPGFANDMAYDAQSAKLFVLFNAQMRLIDPQAPALLSFLRDSGSGQIETTRSGGVIFKLTGGIRAPFAGGVLFVESEDGRSIQRMNTADFTLSEFAVNTEPIVELLASPTDTNLIALVGPSGTQLIRSGVVLPNHTSDTGDAQFSADGTKFYLVNAVDCVLDIFNVDQNGLTLSQTRTNASCSTFTEADGLIYFSTGSIYDPVADKRSSFGLTPPVFVLSRGNQVIDTLSRTNSTWTVQRFAGSDRHLLRSVALPKLSPLAGILRFEAAGSDRVAIASTGALSIVNLAEPVQVSIGVSLRDPAMVSLEIDSALGASYRLETAAAVGTNTWTTAQDNLAGSGGIIETTVPIQGRSAFFRAVRKSP